MENLGVRSLRGKHFRKALKVLPTDKELIEKLEKLFTNAHSVMLSAQDFADQIGPEGNQVFKSIVGDCEAISEAAEFEVRCRKLQLLGVSDQTLKEALHGTATLMVKQGLGDISMKGLLEIINLPLLEE